MPMMCRERLVGVINVQHRQPHFHSRVRKQIPELRIGAGIQGNAVHVLDTSNQRVGAFLAEH